MDQHHYLVNLDKKQVIHPHQIGNGLKLYEQFVRDYSTSTALIMLLASACRGGPRGGGDFQTKHPLVGAWAGDRIAFIGDAAQPDDIPGFDARHIFRYANAASYPKYEKPSCGWINISAQVRDMMSQEFAITYEGEDWFDIKRAEDRPVSSPRRQTQG